MYNFIFIVLIFNSLQYINSTCIIKNFCLSDMICMFSGHDHYTYKSLTDCILRYNHQDSLWNHGTYSTTTKDFIIDNKVYKINSKFLPLLNMMSIHDKIYFSKSNFIIYLYNCTHKAYLNYKTGHTSYRIFSHICPCDFREHSLIYNIINYLKHFSLEVILLFIILIYIFNTLKIIILKFHLNNSYLWYYIVQLILLIVILNFISFGSRALP